MAPTWSTRSEGIETSFTVSAAPPTYPFQKLMTEASDNTAKAVMRVHMRALRRNLVREHPEADWQAGDRAEEMLAALRLKKPGVIAVYRASGNEIDPRPLAENMIKLGWTVALPVCEELDAPIVFRGFKPGDRLAPDVMEIAAPLASAPEVTPHIVITPLLAFDRHGHRLGQGGGYYDRTIAALRMSQQNPVIVGLAYAGQEVERVPTDDHDQKLDAILTESGYRPLP
jgi:5-formyltetrahydrofolate cyclo-ligase